MAFNPKQRQGFFFPPQVKNISYTLSQGPGGSYINKEQY
jgi:hypothetical protein